MGEIGIDDLRQAILNYSRKIVDRLRVHPNNSGVSSITVAYTELIPQQYTGNFVYVATGTMKGFRRRIIDNDQFTLYIYPDLPVPVPGGDEIIVVEPENKFIDITLQDNASANGNGVTALVNGYSSMTFQVTGTFSATVNFEGSIDEVNFVPLFVIDGNGKRTSTTTTAGIFKADITGLSAVRARISNYVSGSVTVISRAMYDVRSTEMPVSIFGGDGTSVNVTAEGKLSVDAADSKIKGSTDGGTTWVPVKADSSGNLSVLLNGRSVQSVLARAVISSNRYPAAISVPNWAIGVAVQLKVYGVTGTFQAGQGIYLAIHNGFDHGYHIYKGTTPRTSAGRDSVIVFPNNNTATPWSTLTGDTVTFIGTVLPFDLLKIEIMVSGTFAAGEGFDCEVKIIWLR